MRKIYESPLAEIEKFTVEDAIITASGGQGYDGSHITLQGSNQYDEFTGEPLS